MPEAVEQRDAFLSHRGVDKAFVRKLAADIENIVYRDRHLSTWLDEAEIRPGNSVPGMINYGLERSRFIILAMTSAYFTSESGWTDAEWHAALYRDPDNRKGCIVPVIAGDCPYIPMILRHLSSLDLRERTYARDFERLIAILRDEPIPRPLTHRGQLIRLNGSIDRSTLIAERAVPEGDPDPVKENLSCNLLPIERMPLYLYEAPIHTDLLETKNNGTTKNPSKSKLRDRIRNSQRSVGDGKTRMPAFRVLGSRIISFHDLEGDDSVLAAIVDQTKVQTFPVREVIRDEDDRKVVISLLNMSLSRHLMGCGLLVDNNKGNRFYFPPDNGKTREIIWKPYKKQTKRTVTKLYTQGDRIRIWLHQAAYIKVVFWASNFYLQITPTWLLTEDGMTIKGGPEVGRIVNRWVGRERNLSVLYHVQFWTTLLRRIPGPLIVIPVGEQTMDVATVQAYVSQSYGIAGDRKNVLEALDELAPQIATKEEMVEIETYGDEDSETEDFTEVTDDEGEKDTSGEP